MWKWRVRESRPRIWLDEARLAWLRRKVKDSGQDIAPLIGISAAAQSLAWLITGEEKYAKAAISEALAVKSSTGWIYTMSAVCYDWCYELLSASEKKRIREILIRECLKRMLNRQGWYPFRHNFYSYAYDVGTCAIALSGDDPFADYALSFVRSRYRDAMRVLDELFPDGEWSEGCDLNRSATGGALRFLWALKTATGDDLMAHSPHMRNAAQYIIACAKPNGLVYPGGDNDFPHLGDRDREMLLMLAAEFDDPYAQYCLNHCDVEMFKTKRPHAWKDLLWYDPARGEKPLEDIPRSRIFRGHGLVVARSAWGWNENGKSLPISWVTFRCGKYYGRGTHYDNNHFEIYYKGELAIDSGREDDDWGMERSPKDIQKSQFFNYYRRSIAHNTILVHDGSEVMDMGVVNDGGQKELFYVNGVRNEPEHYNLGEYCLDEGRDCNDWVKTAGRWNTGEMLAYTGNNLFTYACGNATKSYSATKMESFIRHILFIHPDLFVVFDRVVTKDPSMRKTWLLHTVSEPRIRAGRLIQAAYEAGRLACVPVLPEKREIRRIGGAGKEFVVGDIHYGCGPKASSGRKSRLNFGELPGAWRVEISPSLPAEEDYFLNVMLLTDKDSKAAPEITCERNSERISAAIALPYQRQVRISFARGARPQANLVIEEHASTLFNGDLPSNVVLEKGRIQ